MAIRTGPGVSRPSAGGNVLRASGDNSRLTPAKVLACSHILAAEERSRARDREGIGTVLLAVFGYLHTQQHLHGAGFVSAGPARRRTPPPAYRAGGWRPPARRSRPGAPCATARGCSAASEGADVRAVPPRSGPGGALRASAPWSGSPAEQSPSAGGRRGSCPGMSRPPP